MRCPVCKADNATGPACRRCKADLSPLYKLEASRDAALDAAGAAAEVGDWLAVLAAAGWADHLRRDEMTCQLLGLACVMLGRFEEARAWAVRWQSLGELGA